MRKGAAPRRVLLVGFMGSGKSAVGAALARRLEWRFIDCDAEVEKETGASIAEIFREGGEDAFRDVEARVTRRALGEDRAVIASGGGWPAREGRMESVGRGTLTVWLRVTLEEALRRVSRGGEAPRPLLQGPGPATAAAALMARRDRYYRMAGLHLDAVGESEAALADRISGHLREWRREAGCASAVAGSRAGAEPRSRDADAPDAARKSEGP